MWKNLKVAEIYHLELGVTSLLVHRVFFPCRKREIKMCEKLMRLLLHGFVKFMFPSIKSYKRDSSMRFLNSVFFMNLQALGYD